MNIVGSVILSLLVIVFLAYGYLLIASRFFYHAQVCYHWLHERECYDHFKAALQQIKDVGPLTLYPLTYWIREDVLKNYIDDGPFANYYHLIVLNGHVSLYKGNEVVLTDFSYLLIRKLIKESKITKKNVQLLILIEYRSDQLGYPNFMAKYFGPDWHTKNISYKDFLVTFVDKDEQCTLIRKEKK